LKRRLLTITLAALLAVFGAAAVLSYVRQANDRAVAGLKAETVLMATGAIPAGTSLGEAQKEKLLTTEKVPVASLSADPVQSVTGANQNLVVSGPVGRGQLLVQQMLVKSAAQVTSGGPLNIPPRMIAVTMELCLPQAVAGYIGVGSYVAVFDTFSTQKAVSMAESCGDSHSTEAVDAVYTQIVLPRVLILCVGQAPTGCGQSASSASGSTLSDPSTSSASSQGDVMVTLAVSQRDAERLITVEETGMPYLALTSTTSSTGSDSGLTPLFSTIP
jgi:pilus assembly protein CpaB